MFYLNKSKDGKIFNMLFGLCQLLDGFARIVTLGFVATNYTLNITRWKARKNIDKLKNRVLK